MARWHLSTVWRAGAVTMAAVGLFVSGCAGTEPADTTIATTAEGPSRLSVAQRARCGSLGKPVSLTRLVRVFRANGITLDMDESTCRLPLKKRASGLEIAATNAGPDGLSGTAAVDRREGFVLCSVTPKRFETSPSVVKYSTDQETNARVLNITCAVYPSDTESEAAQVERLRRALAALTKRQ